MWDFLNPYNEDDNSFSEKTDNCSTNTDANIFYILCSTNGLLFILLNRSSFLYTGVTSAYFNTLRKELDKILETGIPIKMGNTPLSDVTKTRKV